MWSNLYDGLLTSLQPSHLLVIMVGTVAGLIIGALPGLSAVSGVALLLPFTFGMEPAQGLMMLAAVYMSAEYGGSISAILINTPGTSGAACTVLDGTPLTRKGQAQEALYISLLAGTVGGAFGGLVLIFFTPLLARASLFLGPPEIFWLTLAGLFLVASLSGRRIVKGLVGAAIGLVLAEVGQDAMTGDIRFTFDMYQLTGGVPVVPALLGLFAVASILALLEQPKESVAPLILRKGVLGYIGKRLLDMKVLLAWSSVLGTLIGIVPGAGASISAFVAYGEAKRLSKHPEEFGRGSYEGVAAPECANNAVVGGAMVPLLGLGIPGSGSAAVMAGALTVHGIIPGPRLFVERAEIVYTFMAGLMLTVVAMLIVGLISIPWSSLIVRIPRRVMIPSVLVLSAIGTYGLSNSLFDVYTMLAIGFVAYVLDKLGVPIVTIALGLVLGGLLEEGYQQSVLVGQVDQGSVLLYFAGRPLTIVFMLLAGAILIGGIVQVLRERKNPDEAPAIDARDNRGPSLRAANIVFALVVLAIALFTYLLSQEFSREAALFPRLVAYALFLLGGILLIGALIPGLAGTDLRTYPFAGVPWRSIATVAGGLVLLSIGAGSLGFYESSFLFCAAIYFVLSPDTPLGSRVGLSCLYALGFVTLIYLMFRVVLHVPTPPGLLV